MIGCETYCSLCFYEVFAFLPSTCTSRPFSPPPPFFFFFAFVLCITPAPPAPVCGVPLPTRPSPWHLRRRVAPQRPVTPVAQAPPPLCTCSGRPSVRVVTTAWAPQGSSPPRRGGGGAPGSGSTSSAHWGPRRGSARCTGWSTVEQARRVAAAAVATCRCVGIMDGDGSPSAAATPGYLPPATPRAPTSTAPWAERPRRRALWSPSCAPAHCSGWRSHATSRRRKCGACGGATKTRVASPSAAAAAARGGWPPPPPSPAAAAAPGLAPSDSACDGGHRLVPVGGIAHARREPVRGPAPPHSSRGHCGRVGWGEGRGRTETPRGPTLGGAQPVGGRGRVEIRWRCKRAARCPFSPSTFHSRCPCALSRNGNNLSPVLDLLASSHSLVLHLG